MAVLVYEQSQRRITWLAVSEQHVRIHNTENPWARCVRKDYIKFYYNTTVCTGLQKLDMEHHQMSNVFFDRASDSCCWLNTLIYISVYSLKRTNKMANHCRLSFYPKGLGQNSVYRIKESSVQRCGSWSITVHLMK